MTREDYAKYRNDVLTPLSNKYHELYVYIILDYFNIGYIEEILKEMGYHVVRTSQNFQQYSQIFFEGAEIGVIRNIAEFPSVELFKGNKKHAKIISKSDFAITPIKGFHTVLGWHTVKDKIQTLATGVSIIHFKPAVLDDVMVEKYYQAIIKFIPVDTD